MGEYTEQAGRQATLLDRFDKGLEKYGIIGDNFFALMIKDPLFAGTICLDAANHWMRIESVYPEYSIIKPIGKMTYVGAYLWLTHTEMFVPVTMTDEIRHLAFKRCYLSGDNPLNNVFQYKFVDYQYYYKGSNQILVYQSPGTMTFVLEDMRFSSTDVILVRDLRQEEEEMTPAANSNSIFPEAVCDNCQAKGENLSIRFMSEVGKLVRFTHCGICGSDKKEIDDSPVVD